MDKNVVVNITFQNMYMHEFNLIFNFETVSVGIHMGLNCRCVVECVYKLGNANV